MNNVIIYFPWGAGGNLIKNIASIDTELDFFDENPFKVPDQTAEDRFNFFIEYYTKSIAHDQWLTREWAIRKKYTAKYHENSNIAFWDPDCRTIYECHGSEEELGRILDPSPLLCYDRTRIDAGELLETPSPWKLTDCLHVFLLPKNLQLITDIYHSKNPELEPLHPSTSEGSKKKHLFFLNRLMNIRLGDFATTLQSRGCAVYKYTADDLFTNTGYTLINDVFQDVSVNVPAYYVETLHKKWLEDTRELYKNFHNRELP